MLAIFANLIMRIYFRRELMWARAYREEEKVRVSAEF